MAWVLATVPCLPSEGLPEVFVLFESLRREVFLRVNQFESRDLFIVCWGYSTARLLDQDLHAHIACNLLRLAHDRDGPGGTNLPGCAVLEEKEGRPSQKNDRPYILAEGLHWFALYKPPFWQVTVARSDKPQVRVDTDSGTEAAGASRSRSAGASRSRSPEQDRIAAILWCHKSCFVIFQGKH